ncbi:MULTISPECIES: PTS lactose/cellobiose transporter subunit IIA [Streptomyces]|uniref:PTS lactose/cellobiose transporter subunit IIA n=1 Tax=Streptomyces lycopersici TaxID=2974589 RepID=UPI0021D06F80|nr:PTS lactose/cellobiose transporter subunit IIA [Streptomyces sp. NEAU-383]
MEQDAAASAAMQILMGAGEARKFVSEAIGAIADWDYGLATDYLAQAQEALREAHVVHTDIIQAEAGGAAAVGFPVLFSHAQDTMMTTDSEIRLVRKLLVVFRAVGERLDAVAPHTDATDGTRENC